VTDVTHSQEAGEPEAEHAGGHDDHDGEQHHLSDWQYIKIALFLAVVTLIEVVIYYFEDLGDLLTVMLIVLSAIKFGVVVLWFMHLKQDSRLFRRLFVTGLILAFAIYAIVLTVSGVWSR
jgi:cytochrome c oxidase subunit IV